MIDYPESRPEGVAESMGLLAAIEKRWSAQSFLPRSVDEDVIRGVLEAARLAPSAKNRQEWRFIVVTKPELRGKLADAAFGAEQMVTAPVIITACTTNIDYRMPNGQLSYPIDLGVAASFMLLQAAHAGLGSCALTTFDEQEVKDLLSIPHAMRVVMMVALGHVEQEQRPARARKPLADIISYEHW